MLEFNISSAAPTLQEIDEERRRVDAEIRTLTKHQRQMSIAEIISFFVFCGSVIAALLAIASGVVAGGAADVSISVAGTAETIAASGVGAIAFAANHFSSGRLARLGILLAELKTRSDALLPVDKEACLDIKLWLNDSAIDNYRSQVVKMGREFMRGDVGAMRALWESRESRKSDEANAAAIEAACKEVYFGKALAES